MTRLVLCIAFSLLALFGVESSAEKPGEIPSATSSAFIAWRDSVGLSNTINIVEERSKSPKRYVLVLDARQVEAAVGRVTANDLYTKLFSKVVGFTELSPNQVELQVRSREGGYCDPDVIQNTVTVTKGQLVIARKTYQSGRGARCALDFEGIRRYESATRLAVGKMSKTAFAIISDSTAGALTTEKLRQYLLQRFTNKGGALMVTSISENWLAATVRQIQREVIRDQNYWERLQIMVMLERIAEGFRIRLILDGKYGSGLAAPSDQGYIDMEPTYTSYWLNTDKDCY